VHRTGLWLVLFSFVNISFIENLISRPILCGFVSATGLLIIIEQCTAPISSTLHSLYSIIGTHVAVAYAAASELFGINLLYHDWFRFIELVFRIQSANIATFVLGFVSIILHLAIGTLLECPCTVDRTLALTHEQLPESAKRYPTRYERNTLVSLIPTTFIVVACGLAVSVLLDLPNEYHVEVIGPIDTSAFLIPWLPLPSGIFLAIRQTVVPSATLAIFIMAHSIGTSKVLECGGGNLPTIPTNSHVLRVRSDAGLQQGQTHQGRARAVCLGHAQRRRRLLSLLPVQHVVVPHRDLEQHQVLSFCTSSTHSRECGNRSVPYLCV